MVKIAEQLNALRPLLKMITVRQVIEAGDKAIDACGLNPWCINEGRATGNEPALSDWKIDSLIAEIAELEERAGQLKEEREPAE